MASPASAGRAVRFGPFELDLHSGSLHREGRYERLALQPSQVLILLVQRGGELVSREELRARLWPDETFVDFDHGLNNAINRLREALRDSATTPEYIQTVPRRGYRFIATLERVTSAVPGEPAGVIAPPETAPATASAEWAGSAVPAAVLQPPRRLLVALLLIALIAAAGAIVWRGAHRPATHSVAAVPGEASHPARSASVDPTAYDLYLQASYHAQHLNREDNDRAIALLQQSIARDPRFAPAYAAIAYEYRTRGEELNHSDEASRRNAFVAAERCIEVNPDLADCYAARATVLWTASNHFPHASAIADLKHALSLNANLAEAHHQLANIYNHIGLLEKAQAHLERAELLNPANPGTRFRVAINLIYQGKYDEALDRLQPTPRFSPSLWAYQTSFAMVQLGRQEEASTILKAAEQDDKSDTVALLKSMEAVLSAGSGHSQIAQQKIDEAIRLGSGFQHFHHSEYAIACAYALMKENAKAVEWLRRAASDGFPCYPMFARDRNLAGLRGDPQFQTFMAELRNEWLRNRNTL